MIWQTGSFRWKNYQYILVFYISLSLSIFSCLESESGDRKYSLHTLFYRQELRVELRFELLDSISKTLGELIEEDDCSPKIQKSRYTENRFASMTIYFNRHLSCYTRQKLNDQKHSLPFSFFSVTSITFRVKIRAFRYTTLPKSIIEDSSDTVHRRRVSPIGKSSRSIQPCHRIRVQISFPKFCSSAIPIYKLSRRISTVFRSGLVSQPIQFMTVAKARNAGFKLAGITNAMTRSPELWFCQRDRI